jgi:hypothetical protein
MPKGSKKELLHTPAPEDELILSNSELLSDLEDDDEEDNEASAQKV